MRLMNRTMRKFQHAQLIYQDSRNLRAQPSEQNTSTNHCRQIATFIRSGKLIRQNCELSTFCAVQNVPFKRDVSQQLLSDQQTRLFSCWLQRWSPTYVLKMQARHLLLHPHKTYAAKVITAQLRVSPASLSNIPASTMNERNVVESSKQVSSWSTSMFLQGTPVAHDFVAALPFPMS